MMNKKGQFTIILYVILALIVIYLIVILLGNFIPFFSFVESQVNFYLLLAFWIVFQVALIFCFYKMFTYVFRNYILIKNKIMKWSFSIQKYIITKK